MAFGILDENSEIHSVKTRISYPKSEIAMLRRIQLVLCCVALPLRCSPLFVHAYHPNMCAWICVFTPLLQTCERIVAWRYLHSHASLCVTMFIPGMDPAYDIEMYQFIAFLKSIF